MSPDRHGRARARSSPFPSSLVADLDRHRFAVDAELAADSLAARDRLGARLAGGPFARWASSHCPRQSGAVLSGTRCEHACKNGRRAFPRARSEEPTSELQALMRLSFAVL